MTNQAIIRHTQVSVVVFTGVPSEATRKALIAAGYNYNRISRQWVKSNGDATVETEEAVMRGIAA